MTTSLPTRLCSADLSEAFALAAVDSIRVAVDTETDGLEPGRHQLRLVQVCVPGVGIEILRVDPLVRPDRLLGLLTSSATTKVFHHAVFDVAFCMATWKVDVRSVRCTKISSKLLDPGPAGEHTLAGLASRYLGIVLDKSPSTSDWSAALSPEQVAYAANDVRYLCELEDLLIYDLRRSNLLDLAVASWDYVPTRAALELAGIGDVFTH